MHWRVLLVLGAVVIGAACGASDTKAPTEDLDDPADTLEGSWVVQMFAVQGPVGGCPQNGQVGLKFDDVGKTEFTGTFQASAMVCSGPPIDTLLVASGSVTNGSVTADSIKFAMGNAAFVGWPSNGGWQGSVTFTTNTTPTQYVHASWSMLAASHTQ